MREITWNLSPEPRRYQSEAAEWALSKSRATCCLPTGTGKTLVAVLWLKSLFGQGKISNALVLEPTRLLVNQTTGYLFDRAEVACVPIDGRSPRPKREELWRSTLVVATPETTFNDIKHVHFGAVVVDECHHTVGQDAFARVMMELRPAYKLGLSAFIPLRREQQITELIGPIRRWSWHDPEIAPYVPNWIGEVYEANLNAQELELLKVMRQLPTGPGLNPALLERYLTRDGSVAVRETLSKKNALAQAFGELLLAIVPDRMHKLETVREILDSHEPRKAIIFADRVVIADRVSTSFPQLQAVTFKGKRSRFDQGTALQQARNQETRLVVSTSAGEEGIDLPSADLLVIWGNAASDIRFIQRLGRMMRKTGEGLKFATFVVTPESSDFDSFALGLAKAAETGTIDVEKTFGWDPEVLWPRTTWWHVSKLLRYNPQPLSKMAQALEVRDELAEKIVTSAVRRGRLFYIYDAERIVAYAADKAEEWARSYVGALMEESAPHRWQFQDRLRKAAWRLATSMMGRMRQYRIYALTDDVIGLREKYVSRFSSCDCRMFLEARYTGSHARGRAQSLYALRQGLWTGVSPSDDLSQVATRLARINGVQSVVLSRRKSERLEYFFQPRTEEVLKAVVENAARLFELIDSRSSVKLIQ